MGSKPLTKGRLEDFVEKRDRAPSMHVKQTLVQIGKPVLLIVAEGVDRPEEAELLLREPEVLAGELDALLKADRAPCPLSKTGTFFSRSDALSNISNVCCSSRTTAF